MSTHTLAIIGDDLLYSNRKRVIEIAKKSDTMWIGGDNINHLNNTKWDVNDLKKHCSEIFFAKDGFGDMIPLEQGSTPVYIPDVRNMSPLFQIYDIGPKSLVELGELIKKHSSSSILREGNVGKVHYESFKFGTDLLNQLLS